MIKKVIHIKTLKDKFKLPVDILKLTPPLKLDRHPLEAEYITGGFYNTKGYSMYAFYVSDSEGNIIDTQPIIQDEGFNTYAEIFWQLEYTYI